MIDSKTIAEIRAAADIVDVAASAGMDPYEAGGHWKAECYVCNQTAMYLTKDSGFFYCFSCKNKGDVFSLVQGWYDVGFNTAAQMLWVYAIAGEVDALNLGSLWNGIPN